MSGWRYCCRCCCCYCCCCTRPAQGRQLPRVWLGQRSCVSSSGERLPVVIWFTEHIRTGLPAALRIERIAQPVTEQVEGHHGEEDGQARNDHVHRVDRVVAVADRVLHHPAPARRGRDDADAEIGQRRLEQNVGRDQQRGV